MKGKGLEHEMVSTTSTTQHDQKGFPVVRMENSPISIGFLHGKGWNKGENKHFQVISQPEATWICIPVSKWSITHMYVYICVWIFQMYRWLIRIHKVVITQLYPATNWDAPPVGMSQKCTRLLSTRACGYLRRISPGNAVRFSTRPNPIWSIGIR